MIKPKVLWLCSWYPDKTEPYNGDFVKRHAEAAADFCDLHVIHVVRDKEGVVTRSVKTEETRQVNFTETVIYYYVPVTGIRLFEKFLSHQWYEKLYRRTVKDYIQKNGLPALVHVHMGMKAGITALWIENKYKVPYVVSEHWSGFLDNAKEQFSATPKRFRKSWSTVINNAAAVSAVSQTLAKGLQQNFPGLQPFVIPNVVDTRIFFPGHEKVSNPAPRFVHISGMQELKNPRLILQAFKQVLQSNPGARLDMIGKKDEYLISLAEESGFADAVVFYDEMPQSELAKFIRQSAALILFSSYETFGCVIIEANACGVPVIVSDIPVFHETVKYGINGYFAKAGDADSLAEIMMKAVAQKENLSPEQIAKATAEKYSYPVIGKKIADWYQQILQG